MKVTALAGGVGGAKLLVGLDRALANGGELTAIVNTGDDATIYGVHVSPDVDIVTYWLSGLADYSRGWGLQDDTFDLVDALQGLGAEAWFRLGDRDFATCLYRTERLKAGVPLHEVTREIASALGARPRIIPMTNDRVATMIETTDGRTLEFQHYFVKEQQRPEVKAVHFSGIEDATPAPGVVTAIEEADKVILCPSNPLVSIGPILALEPVREALRAHDDVTAVTPIVQGAALKGPADRMLSAIGATVSGPGVAELYRDFVTKFVIDSLDRADAVAIEALGLGVASQDTVMVDHNVAERLARSIL